jgi:hypothetical protein
MIKNLPDSLYERLTQDKLVLKPLYAAQHPQLEKTCVSAYPAGEYDRGASRMLITTESQLSVTKHRT